MPVFPALPAVKPFRINGRLLVSYLDTVEVRSSSLLVPTISFLRLAQYGLIAEEVAKVYPELVANDNDGQPYSVRYLYIITMLLNEVQKQYHRAEAGAKVITVQGAEERRARAAPVAVGESHAAERCSEVGERRERSSRDSPS